MIPNLSDEIYNTVSTQTYALILLGFKNNTYLQLISSILYYNIELIEYFSSNKIIDVIKNKLFKELENRIISDILSYNIDNILKYSELFSLLNIDFNNTSDNFNHVLSEFIINMIKIINNKSNELFKTILQYFCYTMKLINKYNIII